MVADDDGAKGPRVDEFLTRKELADLLHVTVRTLDAWHSEGRGPKRIKAGRRVLYPRSKVREFLDQCAEEEGSEPAA